MIARSRPPTALIVNPNAGRLSERTREDVVAALRSRFHLDVYATSARETGISIAQELADRSTGLVIAFGGDGHVNEVANGLAHTDSALAIVPGGTMNVFARALGIPTDPFEAIARLVDVAEDEAHAVNLGRMDDRYFTFSAGVGFDAEAADRVERYVPNKRRFGEVFFFWSAFRVLAGSYRHRKPTMLLSGPFGEVAVAMAIACNAGPYAYLAGRPVRVAPEVKLEKGLDVFALTSMRIEALPLYMWRSVVSGDLVHHDDAVYMNDLDTFEIASDTPFARHVDGEPLTPAISARFSIERSALWVKG